jgi:hypothetical protein
MSDTYEDAEWMTARLRPGDTALAAVASLLWMGLIGACIASFRIVSVVTAAYGVQRAAISNLVSSAGEVTLRLWFLSFPAWSVVFLLTMIWALRNPDTRQSRLSAIICILALGLFVEMIATYLPMAQAAHSIANPMGYSP